MNAFTNADESFADPPDGLRSSFLQNTETVGELLLRFPPDKNPKEHLFEVQEVLLNGIRNQSVVGNYSIMHDNAVYQFGYFSEQAKRLAYMCVFAYLDLLCYEFDSNALTINKVLYLPRRIQDRDGH